MTAIAFFRPHIKSAQFRGALFVLVLGFMFQSCIARPRVNINCKNPNLKYMGRIDQTSAYESIIYWSGSSVTMNFTGTEVKVRLKDEHGLNYFYAIVDGQQFVKLKTEPIEKLYDIVSGLPEGKHSVQLYKITEVRMGKTSFYGFEISDGGKVLPPPPDQQRKIEFYGNSITSGYSIDDTVSDQGGSEFFDHYYTYGAITARHFDAAFHCISKSGIGIMISWFPLIMPEMYDRLNPDVAADKWDFSKFTPDVVVVNQLQNDATLSTKTEHPQFKARFGDKAPGEQQIVEAYKNFITSVRSKYPNATIICVLGSMGATKPGEPWPGYIEKAVAQMHDQKILTHFFPYKNTPGHPKRKEQAVMAESLIHFIGEHVKW